MALLDWFRRTPARPALDPAWLARDAELLRRFAAILDRPPAAVDALRSALTGEWRPRDRDHGVLALAACEYGGTATVTLSAVAHRGRIAVLDAAVSWSGSPGRAQLDIFRAEIGERLVLARDPHLLAVVARRTTRDDDVLAALHAERIAALGPPPVVDVPPALAGPLATLTDVAGDLMVGDVFGYAATRTPGSLAVAALVAARRADLLAVVLRGPSPGGRVFAARALLAAAAGPPTADDRRVLDLLRRSRADVAACAGCTVWDTTVADLLAEA